MNLAQLLKKAFEDPEFGQRLIKDPREALKEVDIEPTQARLQAIQDLESVFISAARAFAFKIENI